MAATTRKHTHDYPSRCLLLENSPQEPNKALCLIADGDNVSFLLSCATPFIFILCVQSSHFRTFMSTDLPYMALHSMRVYAICT